MDKKEIVKSYVRPDNTAVINCPNCKRQKELKVEAFTGSKSRLKIKCGCKKVFLVQLESRKRYRKRTNLSGTYINHSQHNSSGKLYVRNISVSGLEFTTMDIHTFKLEDELSITFTLDDEQRTEVTKDVIVRGLRKHAIGCEFERSGDLAFDGPLGFYIMK
jgi:hypothetical protein